VQDRARCNEVGFVCSTEGHLGRGGKVAKEVEGSRMQKKGKHRNEQVTKDRTGKVEQSDRDR
jgi:hypothetical protein